MRDEPEVISGRLMPGLIFCASRPYLAFNTRHQSSSVLHVMTPLFDTPHMEL